MSLFNLLWEFGALHHQQQQQQQQLWLHLSFVAESREGTGGAPQKMYEPKPSSHNTTQPAAAAAAAGFRITRRGKHKKKEKKTQNAILRHLKLIFLSCNNEINWIPRLVFNSKD